MPPQDFIACHRDALERDEVRHNVLLAILDRLATGHPPEPRWWSLDGPGACAVQVPGYPVVLGDVTQAQCHALADTTRDLDCPGVVGPERTAPWFAERAVELGMTFLDPVPQRGSNAARVMRRRSPAFIRRRPCAGAAMPDR